MADIVERLRAVADARRRGNRFDSIEYEAADAIEALRSALTEISTGEGVYGAQAHEYKQIARAALGD